MFKEFLEKSAILKIAAQTFKDRGFLNIFLSFWGFEAHFLTKIFVIKETCMTVNKVSNFNLFDKCVTLINVSRRNE